MVGGAAQPAAGSKRLALRRHLEGLGGPLLYTFGLFVRGAGFAAGLASGMLLASIVANHVSQKRRFRVDPPETRHIADINDPRLLELLLRKVPEWVKTPGLEKAAWVNFIMAKAWPHIDVAASTLFEDKVWPAGKEMLAEKGIRCTLTHLTFGTIPAMFDYIKAVDTPADECIMEGKLRMATNSNMLLDVAFCGTRFAVQVKEMQMDAVVRVRLAPLTAHFPCFAGAMFSLMAEPEMDAAVVVAGSDVMAVSFIERELVREMRHQLASRFLWPKAFLLPLQHESLQGSRHAVGTLEVRVRRAHGLVYKGISLPAPYVVARMGEHRLKRTKHRQVTCDPSWNEPLLLSVEDAEADVLELVVLDYHVVHRNYTLGRATVRMDTLQPGVQKDLVLNLEATPQSTAQRLPPGNLEVSLLFRKFQEEEEPPPVSMSEAEEERSHSGGGGGGGTGEEANGEENGNGGNGVPTKPGGDGSGLLEVLVHEGIDLEPKNDGNVNAFCTLVLGDETRKTRIVQHRTNPRWHEEVEFLLPCAPMEQTLRVEVWHAEPQSFVLLRRSEVRLGAVDARLADVVDNKHIIDDFQLMHAKQGKLKLEMTWRSHV